MDEDNILLADTLLILQMQQELETGKRMPRRYSVPLTWWLLGCMDQQYGKVNKFILIFSSLNKKKDFLTHEHLRTMPIYGMQALVTVCHMKSVSGMILNSDNKFCNNNIS